MSIFGQKQATLTERDFAATGKVSIWVGDFDNEDALLDYVEDERGFGTDFGCRLLHRRELSVEPHPKPIRELLHGFSWFEQFINEAVRAAGDTRARCAVVSHASDYTLLRFTPKPTARLRFLCVASFGGREDAA
jgi:hypothetical protein